MSGVDELLDLVNEQDDVIGQVRRSEAWARRLSVRGVNAFVRNSRGQLWLPRRTADKRNYPSCLDMSVGGHVESGEDYLTCFRRETQEELRWDIDTLNWREIAAFSPFETTLSCFMRVYEIQSETAPDYNPADFSEALWLTPRQFLARVAGGEAVKGDLTELVRRCYGEEL